MEDVLDLNKFTSCTEERKSNIFSVKSMLQIKSVCFLENIPYQRQVSRFEKRNVEMKIFTISVFQALQQPVVVQVGIFYIKLQNRLANMKFHNVQVLISTNKIFKT